MKIEFVGPAFDASGYAANTRSFVQALNNVPEVDLSLTVVSFENQRTDHGEAGALCNDLRFKKHKKPDFQIINTTPEFYDKLRKNNCPVIAYTTFETSRIPDLWVKELNKVDAVMTTSRWCKEVFEESGVEVPVFSVPPGLNPDDYQDYDQPQGLIDLPEADFYFYSIFQWTERKNGQGLLRSYWSEFTGNDDVCLVLKSYKNNTSEEEKKQLKKILEFIKYNFKLDHFPKVAFLGDLLTHEEMKDIHRRCDAFVLPQRAEGFGMPHFDAMAYGNPVITTNYGGSTEFCGPDTAWVSNYQLTPVSNMPWTPWYEGTMYWAEPDLVHFKQLMRHVYDNREETKKVAMKAREWLLDEFSWDKRINQLLRVLKEL